MAEGLDGSHRSSIARALSNLWSSNGSDSEQSSWTFGLVCTF